MSDTSAADANGAANGAGDGAQPQAPQIRILGQYIKDLSFENPNAPRSLIQGEQPKLDINVNVGAQQVGDDQFEVILTLNAKAERPDMVMFNVELVYAGLFKISGVPADHMHPFVMIECPRMLFPFVRRIVSDVTRDGGFPPMNLEPIDFLQLYRNELARSAHAHQADTAHP